MIISKISTDTLSVFKTFDYFKVPPHLTVQSLDGDHSMLGDLPTIGLSIVGSRSPQRRSLELLERTIQELRHTRLIIVSGFARGIDSRAHELAVQYGLRTVALLGCGIERDYPKENAALRESILRSGGLIISQFEDEAPPLARNFHDRNGLIAGFSKATWVVEAAEVSGTLNTANWAMKLNRDLYATSCFPDDHYYQGNVKLLSQRDSLRYPVADLFFNSGSLGKSWPDLEEPESTQGSLSLHAEPKSEIQKWVYELKQSNGECQIQTLMNYASKQGYTLGKFYHLFEAEVESGLLSHDSSGRVDLTDTPSYSGMRMLPGSD